MFLTGLKKLNTVLNLRLSEFYASEIDAISSCKCLSVPIGNIDINDLMWLNMQDDHFPTVSSARLSAE